MKTRYFETETLIKKYPKARYYYILGGRSAGKTFPTVRKAIKEAIEGKGDFAYVRRYKEDLKTAYLEQLVNVHSDFVNKLTKGNWNRVVYWRSRIWLEKWDIDENGIPAKIARKQEPLGIICCLNTWEHEKGADFGYERGIKNIIFDEVQEVPRALASLKYFYENAPEYNIICAASFVVLMSLAPRPIFKQLRK